MIVEYTEYIGVNNVEVTEEVTEIHVEYAEMGAQGLDPYQLAVANGYTGTLTEWLDSLKGKSAYELAVANSGYTGTLQEWLNEFMAKTWWDLVLGKVSKGLKDVHDNGTVQPYVFATKAGGTVTLYRYKANDKSIDAFYSGFDGTQLTGLVNQKKVTL